MSIDERTARRFNIIQENLRRLRELATLPEDQFLSDFRNRDSAKYLLQISIEAMLDVSVHLLASLKEPLPDHHAEVFDALARRGVLPSARAETYRKMAAFRNRIVHLYDRVDDHRIFEILRDDLADFDRFISEVVTYLGPPSSSTPP